MRRIAILVVLLGLVAGGAYWWLAPAATTEQAAGRDAGRRGGGRRSGGDPATPVPVLAAPATTGDVQIYLDALGTVQAFNLVSVRAMVDGP